MLFRDDVQFDEQTTTTLVYEKDNCIDRKRYIYFSCFVVAGRTASTRCRYLVPLGGGRSDEPGQDSFCICYVERYQCTCTKEKSKK